MSLEQWSAIAQIMAAVIGIPSLIFESGRGHGSDLRFRRSDARLAAPADSSDQSASSMRLRIFPSGSLNQVVLNPPSPTYRSPRFSSPGRSYFSKKMPFSFNSPTSFSISSTSKFNAVALFVPANSDL